MAQIWLTYEELAAHLRCSPNEARTWVEDKGWDRRRSRDGLTRVKLMPAVAIEYMYNQVSNLGGLVKVDRPMQVGSLRAAAMIMRGYDKQPHLSPSTFVNTEYYPLRA